MSEECKRKILIFDGQFRGAEIKFICYDELTKAWAELERTDTIIEIDSITSISDLFPLSRHKGKGERKRNKAERWR